MEAATQFNVMREGKIAYRVSISEERLTSRGGLLTICQLTEALGVKQQADALFEPPGSNRGYTSGEVLQCLVAMQYAGATGLSGVDRLQDEKLLLELGGMNRIPGVDALARWLRQHGEAAASHLQVMGRKCVELALNELRPQQLTLDVDASLIHCQKKGAAWTYKGQRGYSPMFGTLAETSQVVGMRFRPGNAAPAHNKLSFIKDCQRGLPTGRQFTRLRIDAAGYQREIIEHCHDDNLGFAIRAVMNEPVKELVASVSAQQWQPLRRRDGTWSDVECVARKTHIMTDSEVPFELVLQRRQVEPDAEDGQATLVEPCLPGFEDCTETEMNTGEYRYRAIATDRLNMTDSEVVQWYNQRAECSENVIKQVKSDFNAARLPCNDLAANAAYVGVCCYAYNLLTPLRIFALPSEYRFTRAPTIRRVLIDMGGKMVCHARRWTLNLQPGNWQLLRRAFRWIERLSAQLLVPG